MKLNIKKIVKKHHKFYKIHNKVSSKDNYGNNNENQTKTYDDNQGIEKTQIIVSSEFDNKVRISIISKIP